MEKKVACDTGLRKGIIEKEIFDREISLCKQLAKENKGKCGWGRCKNCGVIALLYKLHEGELLEGEKLKTIKTAMFSGAKSN